MFEMQVAQRRHPIESEGPRDAVAANDLVVFAWSSDESVSPDCGLRDGGRQTSIEIPSRRVTTPHSVWSTFTFEAVAVRAPTETSTA